MFRIAESRKDDITDSIANEIYLVNRAKGLQNANKEARNYVKEVEERDGNILSIISGKEIITKMSSWSQIKFKVSFSSRALLKELFTSEIDKEVLSVISSIETNNPFA